MMGDFANAILAATETSFCHYTYNASTQTRYLPPHRMQMLVHRLKKRSEKSMSMVILKSIYQNTYK